MVKETIATGKTVEEAIRAGAAALGVEEDAVNFEVIETARKGFLGLGSSMARVRVSCETSPVDKAEDFLRDVLASMGLQATVASRLEGGDLLIDIAGPGMGVVIGHRGETLDALQYLTGIVANRDEKEYVKVWVDSENYRKKREETLVRLANNVAQRVLRYGKSVTLEPMNANERRIIHTTLQDIKGVTTYSTGSEPARRIVVASAAKAKPDKQ